MIKCDPNACAHSGSVSADSETPICNLTGDECGRQRPEDLIDRVHAVKQKAIAGEPAEDPFAEEPHQCDNCKHENAALVLQCESCGGDEGYGNWEPKEQEGEQPHKPLPEDRECKVCVHQKAQLVQGCECRRVGAVGMSAPPQSFRRR